MYDPKITFLEYELTYRTDRLKSGLAGGSRRRRRREAERRAAEAVVHAG
jgi:hypothetical protein